MPKIYLSPSTQEYNTYITGSGSEEYWMNLVADAMEPYLRANTIRFTRNTPQMTAASSIAQAAQGEYDFYLALHSNASGDGRTEGQARGIICFYYPTSVKGKEAAEIFRAQLRRIYPLPQKVTVQATTTLGEVRRPKPPANLLELGYHDNVEDARWIESNVGTIARSLVMGLCDYFSLPFIEPGVPQKGVVATAEGPLTLRAYPDAGGPAVGALPRGETVTVYGAYNGWYAVAYGDLAGYAAANYIEL